MSSGVTLHCSRKQWSFILHCPQTCGLFQILCGSHVNNEMCFIIAKHSVYTICFKIKSYHVKKTTKRFIIFNVAVACHVPFLLSAISFASALSVAIRLCYLIFYDALLFPPFNFRCRGLLPFVFCLSRFEAQGCSFPL